MDTNWRAVGWGEGGQSVGKNAALSPNISASGDVFAIV
jgi:hypothetical protein